MVVYVEYVFLENFVLDFTLLTLSLCSAKVKTAKKNLLFSALLGAAFALLFPLLSLPFFCESLLKFTIGFVLCFFAYPHIKTKKQRSRYAFICFFFFCFSFAFAGALFAVSYMASQNAKSYAIEKLPFSMVFAVFVFLCLFSFRAVQKLYQKKRVLSHTYSCAIPYNKRVVAVLGFLDSGNKATKNGVPVCFISPVSAYEIWQEDFLFFEQKTEKATFDCTAENEKYGGQVCDQITIQTLGGEKMLFVRLGELHVKLDNGCVKKQVYFAVSPHILSQDYDLLLPADILEDIV